MTNQQLASRVRELIGDHGVRGEVNAWLREQPGPEMRNGFDFTYVVDESPAQHQLELTWIAYNGAAHMRRMMSGLDEQSFTDWTIEFREDSLGLSVADYPIQLRDCNNWTIEVAAPIWRAIEKRLNSGELELLRGLPGADHCLDGA